MFHFDGPVSIQILWQVPDWSTEVGSWGMRCDSEVDRDQDIFTTQET